MELKMMNMRVLTLSLIVCLSFVVLGGFVGAFAVGVSGDVSLYPGQTLDAGYDVFNTLGGGDIVVVGQFLEGSNVVSFTQGSRFNLPAGSVVSVPVQYKVPANAAVGTVYPIKVIFKTVSEGAGGGSVSFAEDVTRTLNLIVVERPQSAPQIPVKSANINIWWWILAVAVVVILVVWWVLRKKKKR